MRHPTLLPLVFLVFACGGSQATAPPVPPKAAPVPKPADGLSPLGECLKAKGAVMYSASWCKLCHDQLAWLGADAKAVKVIECFPDGLVQTAECEAFLIENFPTWEFSDGRRVEGAYPPEFLAMEIGCPAP